MRLTSLVVGGAVIVAGGVGGYVASAAAATPSSTTNCEIYVNQPYTTTNVGAVQGRRNCTGGTVSGTAELRRSIPFSQDATDVKTSFSGIVNHNYNPLESCAVHGHGTYYGSLNIGGSLDGPHAGEC